MAVKTYSEKLKDPRWQKKRLKIMERDSWKCRDCGVSDDTLHVHHIFYVPRKEPWEAEDNTLLTLCEPCHQIDHKLRAFYEDAIIRLTRLRGFTLGDLIGLTVMIDKKANGFVEEPDWSQFKSLPNV